MHTKKAKEKKLKNEKTRHYKSLLILAILCIVQLTTACTKEIPTFYPEDSEQETEIAVER